MSEKNTPATDARLHKERMVKLKAEQKDRVAKADIERGILIVNTGDGKG